MKKKDPTIRTSIWKERIDSARQRRELYEPTWDKYCLLHTNAYQAVQDINEDETVFLPNGDQVKVGAVFRNIEQTLGMLEVPEIGVRATATDYTRELDRQDTHREAVVEQGLLLSLTQSGLINEEEVIDDIKRDGTIIGHGITYTQWQIYSEEVTAGHIAVLQETDNGFEPVLNEETGQPLFEPIKQKETLWEGCEDVYVSPYQFLFESSAKKIHKASWHGYEDVVELKVLHRDPRFSIPSDVRGTSFTRRDPYAKEDEFTVDNAVKVITIYDKVNRELIVFIETNPGGEESNSIFKQKSNDSGDPDDNNKPDKKNKKELVPIGVFRYPVRFAHPSDSPFSFFIPQPSNNTPMGISQIEHIRNQAVEVDKLRTRAANLTRMLKTIIFFQNGRIDADQLKEAIEAPESSPVGVNLEEGDKWEDLVHEVKFGELPGEVLQQIRQAETDINLTTAIPEQPFTGADTATESENQMTIAGARPKRKQRLLLKFMSEVAKRHKDFLKTFAPDGQVIRFFTADGNELIMEYGRKAFEGNFIIEVMPGGGASNVSPVKQKLMSEVFNMTKGQFGPQYDLLMLRQLLTVTDARDLNAMMKAAREGLGQGAQIISSNPGDPANTADRFKPGEYSNGQTIRQATNLLNERGTAQ